VAPTRRSSGPPQATVEACRGADAAVDDCVAPAFADLPICPATKKITANLCGIRYQRPCNLDSDCGPDFTCGPSDASICPAGSRAARVRRHRERPA